MDSIVSMYWDNIDRRMVDAQRHVFEHFGYPIEQQERTGVRHGDFLDGYMAALGEDDVALLVDIDCFPLNREIVSKAFEAAREGRIFGCAQSSNHIDPDRIFAAPMFLAISRRTWDSLGRPSFLHDNNNDVAQRLSDVAAAAGGAHRFAFSVGVHCAAVAAWRHRIVRDRHVLQRRCVSPFPVPWLAICIYRLRCCGRNFERPGNRSSGSCRKGTASLRAGAHRSPADEVAQKVFTVAVFATLHSQGRASLKPDADASRPTLYHHRVSWRKDKRWPCRCSCSSNDSFFKNY